MSCDAAPLIGMLARLDHRRGREELGLFKVERFGTFVKAVDAGAELAGMVVCMRLIRNDLVQMLVRRMRQTGVPSVNVSPEVFRTHARAARASGIIAAVRQRWTAPAAWKPSGLWIALDDIQSNGNLGCILRTCEAAGVQGVVLVGRKIDPFDPDVVASSMGGLFGLQFVRTTREQLDAWTRRTGIALVGSSPTAATSWDEFSYPERMILWLGNERRGLPSDASFQHSVRIPIFGHADSLNVATAAGILLYEAVRQHKHSKRERRYGAPTA
jgi:RNA methyltransferase, TrmH family